MARSRAVLAVAVGAALCAGAPAARADIGVGEGGDGAGLVAPDAAPKQSAARFAAPAQHNPGWGHGHGRPDYQPGDPGVGDPYFPLEGNGGTTRSTTT
jgi:hypothetical protein